MDISNGLIVNEKTLLDENEKGIIGVSRRTTRLRIYRFKNDYGLYVKFDKRIKQYKIKVIKYISKFNSPVYVLKKRERNLLKLKEFDINSTFQTVLDLIKQVSSISIAIDKK